MAAGTVDQERRSEPCPVSEVSCRILRPPSGEGCENPAAKAQPFPGHDVYMGAPQLALQGSRSSTCTAARVMAPACRPVFGFGAGDLSKACPFRSLSENHGERGVFAWIRVALFAARLYEAGR